MVRILTLKGMCGGSIIASKYVVTAAHCVIGQQLVWVELGGFHPGDMKTIALVSRVIPHPEYDTFKSNTTFFKNDIALLETWFPIDLNIYTPVCLSNTNANENFDFKIAEGSVYREEIQSNLYGLIVPFLYCYGDDELGKSRICLKSLNDGIKGVRHNLSVLLWKKHPIFSG